MSKISHVYKVQKGSSGQLRVSNENKWYVVDNATVEGDWRSTVNSSWSFETEKEAREFAKKKNKGK